MIYALILLYWIFSIAVCLYCTAISFGKITIGDIFKAVLLGWLAWWMIVIITIDLLIDTKIWASFFDMEIWKKK